LTSGLAVDQWTGDQKSHRDAQRHPGGHEADEHRDGRTGTEGGGHAEDGRYDETRGEAPPTEQLPGPLHSDERPQHGDHEDDPCQQQTDLDGVEQEEVHPVAEMCFGLEAEEVVHGPIPEVGVDGIGQAPQDGGTGHA